MCWKFQQSRVEGQKPGEVPPRSEANATLDSMFKRNQRGSYSLCPQIPSSVGRGDKYIDREVPAGHTGSTRTLGERA